MRKILFWTHLAAGVAAGVVILIMCVTGVMLAFERQIVAWADTRGLPRIQAVGQRKPVEDLLANAGAGAIPATLTVRAAPDAPVEIAFGRERLLFVDPYTGAVLGEGSKAIRGFFEGVEGWHRWLGARGEGRELGKSISGAANLVFLLVLCTGPFLWLPRKWSWRNVRAILLFRRGLSGRPRDWNWHNVAGIWCAAPLILVVATAVVMSYTWANNLLYQITGTVPPPVQERRPGVAKAVNPDGLDALLEKARRQSPGWKSITVRLAPGPGVAFTIDEGNGGQPQRRAQLVLIRKTGEVMRWEPFAANNAGRRLRIWSRFVHTGEAGGWIGQWIGLIACCGGALLVWTGFALAWRRLVGWRARRKVGSREVDIPVAEVQEHR